MGSALSRVFRRSVVTTFLAGVFVILPIAITLAIMGWAGAKVQEFVGPGSLVGRALRNVGLRFVTNDTVALLIGWALVILAIWVLGVVVRSKAKGKVKGLIDYSINRVPLVRSIYGPVSQVVGMLKREEKADMLRMPVVFCRFGKQHSAGMLGLLASQRKYRFGGQECVVVYLPTSPIPMSGGIIFAPAELVEKVDMKVDDLMRIYFSLGVMAPESVPEGCVVPEPDGDAPPGDRGPTPLNDTPLAC